jgi:hypothetical protein
MTDFLNRMLHPSAPTQDDADLESDYESVTMDQAMAEVKPQTTSGVESVKTVPMEKKTRKSNKDSAAPSAAKRHGKESKLSGEQRVMRNWKPGRIKKLMRQAGVVSASADSVVLCCHVLQGILQQGVNGSVVFAGLADSCQRRTLRDEDVKRGFQHGVGLALYN